MSLRLTYGVKMSEITNNSTGAGFNKGAAICAYVCLFLAMCSGIAGWLFLAIIPAIVFIVMLYKAGDGVTMTMPSTRATRSLRISLPSSA